MPRVPGIGAVVAGIFALASSAFADTAAPQVAIDVRFVTVNDEFLDRIGVDFGFDIARLPATPAGVPPILVAHPASAFLAGPGELLSRDPGARILGSPRLQAPAGETAQTFAGGAVRYIDLFPKETPPAGAPEIVAFGVSLDIVPTIGPEGQVTLLVKPRATEFALPGQTGPGPAPGLIDRGMDTTVAVPDGGTVVIGGLLTDRSREAAAKIPALGELHILGPLFRRPAGADERRNLIVLVTPRIVGDEEGGGAAAGTGTATAGGTVSPPADEDVFTDIYRRIFGYVPCTHPTRPCEASRRPNQPGDYPRDAGQRDRREGHLD